jgi:hypothetical protein
MSNRIDCVEATNNPRPHQRIVSLGGTRDSDGRRWLASQKEVVGYLESGCRFIAHIQGEWRPLVIAVDGAGHKYVKTALDVGEHPNSLMGLDDCGPTIDS